MNRIEIASARLNTEEGRRRRAYNDATGKLVTCRPNGNLSIGVGINLEIGLDEEEIDWLFSHRLALADTSLRRFAWYPLLDEPRGSVFLDLGFNDGVECLLHFPRTIHAAEIKNWDESANQLLDSDAARELPGRYRILTQILRTGAV